MIRYICPHCGGSDSGYDPAPDPYLATVYRMEADICSIDAGAGWASIAISLKRIATSLEELVKTSQRIESIRTDD